MGELTRAEVERADLFHMSLVPIPWYQNKS